MANEIIRQEFLNRVHTAIVSARNISEIDHAGIRGRAREIFLQKILQPVFCVADRGYWWFKPNEPAEKWIKFMPTENNEEVVELIGGIANTIPEQVIAKGHPRFGEYIIRARYFEKH